MKYKFLYSIFFFALYFIIWKDVIKKKKKYLDFISSYTLTQRTTGTGRLTCQSVEECCPPTNLHLLVPT